jgi:hypothetical protein
MLNVKMFNSEIISNHPNISQAKDIITIQTSRITEITSNYPKIASQITEITFNHPNISNNGDYLQSSKGLK